MSDFNPLDPLGIVQGNKILDPLGVAQKPKVPSPPPVTDPNLKPPDTATAKANVDAAAKAQSEADLRRKRRGRASTILTGNEGAGLPNVATKTLLGG